MATKVKCLICYPITNEKVSSDYFRLGTKKSKKLGLDALFGNIGNICKNCAAKESLKQNNSLNTIANQSIELREFIKTLKKDLQDAKYRRFPRTPIGGGLTASRGLRGCACLKCQHLNTQMNAWDSHAFYRAGIITSESYFLCINCKDQIDLNEPREGCYNLFVMQNWNKIKSEILNNGAN